jgi:hypothetical protein
MVPTVFLSTRNQEKSQSNIMSSLTYALVTPSYWMDVERCRLLVESTERWVAPGVRHHLVIARRDVPLFKSMLSARNNLIVVEDIIPNWLFRLPGVRHFWFSLRTRPVRNWILQQIVKLCVPAAVNEDVLLYADSDMFFIAPFDPHSYERNGNVPLLLETGQRGLIPSNDEWQAVCSRLLGLPVEGECDINYVGQLVWWRRQNAMAAVRRVEEVTGKTWQRAIASLMSFSEYILYGLYCHRILGEKSGHWSDGTLRTLNNWGTTPLTVQDLELFKLQREPYHHSVMVSAKSRTSIIDIRKVFSFQ